MTTKADLVEHLAATELVNKDTARVLLNVIAHFHGEALKESGETSIPGIGKLKLGTRSARTGRNPKTGETLQIPAKQTIKLVASKNLKEAVFGE